MSDIHSAGQRTVAFTLKRRMPICSSEVWDVLEGFDMLAGSSQIEPDVLENLGIGAQALGFVGLVLCGSHSLEPLCFRCRRPVLSRHTRHRFDLMIIGKGGWALDRDLACSCCGGQIVQIPQALVVDAVGCVPQVHRLVHIMLGWSFQQLTLVRHSLDHLLHLVCSSCICD